ncbi:MAG: type II toxin-antitoxin system HicA family toxin [Candidatus Omnitrophica bacterium]|nr:type II toxin-antitoxin system HicA family toxin [Candidatus Omnitrophota bacterium]
MSPKLPRDISGNDFVKLMKKTGYFVDVQQGSHIILIHSEYGYKRLSVPNHKFLKPGLLHRLIKDAGLTREEFLKLR